MPKIKWDGAEEPTINHFYQIDNRKVWKWGSTEASHDNITQLELNRAMDIFQGFREMSF